MIKWFILWTFIFMLLMILSDIANADTITINNPDGTTKICTQTGNIVTCY